MNRPDELARIILDIQKAPQSLREKSFDALAFAAKHTFTRTVSRRIGHLRALEGQPALASGGAAADGPDKEMKGTAAASGA
jgi:hypothetical protein